LRIKEQETRLTLQEHDDDDDDDVYLNLFITYMLLYVPWIQNLVESQNSKDTERTELKNVRLLADKQIALHKTHDIGS
jgi:hypothetical protein